MAVDLLALAPVVERAARDVHKNFPNFHDVEDTTQHLWLFLYENAKNIEPIIRDDFDRTTDNKAVYNLLIKEATKHLRKEDADWHHYTQDDTFFYSLDLIEQILEVVFKHEEWQSFATHYDKMPKGKSDPALAGNNVASYVDVSRALKGLRQDYHDALVWRFKYEYTYDAIADAAGISRQMAHKRVKTALGALQRELGRVDLADLREIPADHERPQNEDAQARTTRLYNG